MSERIDGLKTEDGRPKTEDGGRKTEDGRPKMEGEIETSIPKPKITNQRPRTHSALSIKSLTEKKVATKKSAKAAIDLSKLPSNPFTTAQIQSLWQQLIETKHNKGDKLLASLMRSCNPVAQNNLLKLVLPSKIMKADLEKAKNKILPFLREELQNYKIDFDITVNEEKVKTFAYTPQEKYAYLKEQNELISVLKAKFNLDL